MAAAPAQFNGSELVPLADRQLYLQGYRAALISTLLLIHVTWSEQYGLSWVQLCLVSAVYLTLSLAGHHTWTLRRQVAITVFGAGLLLDGLYLAITTYGSSGLGTPLQYFVLANLVAVTLLASFRTGLKLAIWHALLMGTVFEMERGHALHGVHFTANVAWVDLILPVTLIIGITLATASFAAVNERELRRRNFDLWALSRLAWKLEAPLSPENVAEEFLASLSDDFGVTRAVLLSVDGDHVSVLGQRGMSVTPTSATPVDDALVQELSTSGRTALARNVNSRREPWLAAALPGAVNLICIPLRANGSVTGLLIAEHGGRPGSRIERRTVGIVERCVSYAALSLVNARHLETTRRASATDPLTGVANRRAFDATLELHVHRANKEYSALACMMIDIDFFKSINDEHGHGAGDQVLRTVASQIAANCRQNDIVARYGGEEFVVLLPGMSVIADLVEIAERIRESVVASSAGIATSVSIGVATYPGIVDDASGLVDVADASLYAAKRSGRNCVVLNAVRPALPVAEFDERTQRAGSAQTR
jgi:diguanylate cyclase (GGDEF)-like protein